MAKSTRNGEQDAENPFLPRLLKKGQVQGGAQRAE
jgi:hypothetical protein